MTPRSWIGKNEFEKKDRLFIFLRLLNFVISWKWAIVLPILCAYIFLKGPLRLTGLIVLLVFRLVQMFEMKGAMQHWFCPLFAHAHFTLFMRECVHLRL